MLGARSRKEPTEATWGWGGQALERRAVPGPAPALGVQPAYLRQELVTLQKLHLGLQLPHVGGRGI